MTEEYGTNPNQPIESFTVADLEALVTSIVKNLLKSDTSLAVSGECLNLEHPPAAFLETFGTWEDAQSAEALVDDIYTSRTSTEYESGL
ncbi:MAG: hypothetical protein ACFE0J_11920 [Elainellaceae cyanobacterium]